MGTLNNVGNDLLQNNNNFRFSNNNFAMEQNGGSADLGERYLIAASGSGAPHGGGGQLVPQSIQQNERHYVELAAMGVAATNGYAGNQEQQIGNPHIVDGAAAVPNISTVPQLANLRNADSIEYLWDKFCDRGSRLSTDETIAKIWRNSTESTPGTFEQGIFKPYPPCIPEYLLRRQISQIENSPMETPGRQQFRIAPHNQNALNPVLPSGSSNMANGNAAVSYTVMVPTVATPEPDNSGISTGSDLQLQNRYANADANVHFVRDAAQGSPINFNPSMQSNGGGVIMGAPVGVQPVPPLILPQVGGNQMMSDPQQMHNFMMALRMQQSVQQGIPQGIPRGLPQGMPQPMQQPMQQPLRQYNEGISVPPQLLIAGARRYSANNVQPSNAPNMVVKHQSRNKFHGGGLHVNMRNAAPNRAPVMFAHRNGIGANKSIPVGLAYPNCGVVQVGPRCAMPLVPGCHLYARPQWMPHYVMMHPVPTPALPPVMPPIMHNDRNIEILRSRQMDPVFQHDSMARHGSSGVRPMLENRNANDLMVRNSQDPVMQQIDGNIGMPYPNYGIGHQRTDVSPFEHK